MEQAAFELCVCLFGETGGWGRENPEQKMEVDVEAGVVEVGARVVVAFTGSRRRDTGSAGNRWPPPDS